MGYILPYMLLQPVPSWRAWKEKVARTPWLAGFSGCSNILSRPNKLRTGNIVKILFKLLKLYFSGQWYSPGLCGSSSQTLEICKMLKYHQNKITLGDKILFCSLQCPPLLASISQETSKRIYPALLFLLPIFPTPPPLFFPFPSRHLFLTASLTVN